MNNSGLVPQWKMFSSSGNVSNKSSSGSSLCLQPTHADMWGHKTNGLGQNFALNLGSGPAERSQESQPWGHNNKKRESRGGWNGGGKGGGPSRYDSHSRSTDHMESHRDSDRHRDRDRDRLRNLVPKSDSYGPKSSKSKSIGRGNTKRPDSKSSLNILGSVGRKQATAAAKPLPPKTPTPVQPDPARQAAPSQPAWKVMSVKARKGTAKTAAQQPTSDQAAKEELARRCSEQLLFRKVFGCFQQYHKEKLAKETHHAAVNRKVFNRIRDSAGVRQTSGSQGEDVEEIAFLRNLGWAPEGENSEEEDEGGLTQEEIAAFQTQHKKRAQVAPAAAQEDLDCGSSSSSSESEDDSSVPIFF